MSRDVAISSSFVEKTKRNETTSKSNDQREARATFLNIYSLSEEKEKNRWSRSV